MDPVVQRLEASENMETVIANSTTSPPQAQVVPIASAELRRPCLDLIRDPRQYMDKCVPLFKQALKGDWNGAKRMLNADARLRNAAITKCEGTLLHVAAGTNKVQFVEELMKLLNPCDLELQDNHKGTAFCYAAAVGNKQIAAMMMQKNGYLPQIRDAKGETPLSMAASKGKSDMARYLYTRTKLEEEELSTLFLLCIKHGIYDLAWQMLQTMPKLALVRDEKEQTGLHVLARKPSGFSCQGRWYLQNQVVNSSMNPCLALQLMECLWSKLFSLDYTQMRTLIKQPSQVIFDAAEVGNFHFLAVLMRFDPDLVWEFDQKNRSIIHIAVLHRHASIFNLIHETRFRDEIVTSKDNEGNNLLHCAAKLAPPHQLNLISGAAFQMTHELLWFEEVKKIMPPSETEKKNNHGKTPGELFGEQHQELLTKAESWTKRTAKNCIVVSTLIVTGVFTVAFTLPGGDNNKTGTPNYLKKQAFLIFAISDAIALISSSASILTFLSILISSYAEDRYFRSLPSKLIFGLVAQFISITCMMIAFSIAFFITCYHGLKWVPDFISILAFLPIPLFTFLQFPLMSDIFYSSYFCRSLFQPSKHMLY